MATILSSSDTAPLNSVIICCTTVTTCNLLSKGWLFTIAAWTDWPACCSYSGAGTLCFFAIGGLATGTWGAWGRCCCCVLPWSAARRRHLGWWGLRRTSFPLQSWVFSVTFTSVAAPSHVCSHGNWRDGLSLPPPTGSYSMLVWKCFPSLGSPYAGVCPRTTVGRLFAISPDVAELLAVVALGKSILCCISLHPDSNVAETWRMENFLGLCCPWQGYEEQGQVYDFGLLGRWPTGGCHLLDANNVEDEVHQPVRNIFRRGVVQ
jgi:hypothetical protein